MSGSPEWGRRWRRNERGAELVEFSLVFVLFVFICYALVAFGLAMNLKSNLNHAAAEGARAAVGAGGDCDMTTVACQTTKRDAAIDRVKEAVDGQSAEVKEEVRHVVEDDANNVKIDDCTAFSGSGTTTPGSWCIRVALPFDYGAHPIVPSAPGLGIIMPNTLTASGVVQLSS